MCSPGGIHVERKAMILAEDEVLYWLQDFSNDKEVQSITRSVCIDQK